MSKKKKKKVADEKEFAELIEECRATKNRRKMVVCLERVLDDEENELCEESPLVVKARLLIDELTAHYELVEELQKREKAVEVLTKRERGEITRVRAPNNAVFRQLSWALRRLLSSANTAVAVVPCHA